MLHALSAEGRTIIMVTHEDEVAQQAQRQIMIRTGRPGPVGYGSFKA